jgi:hypothetical protein
MPRATATVALALLAACESEAPATASTSALEQEFGLTPAALGDRVAELGWQAPEPCPQVYRVRVDETYPEGLEARMHTRAEHSESWLVLAADADAKPEARPPGPVPEDRPFVGRTLFRGPKTQDRVLTRELGLSAALLGPASPDAPCFERTWDPVEDALALAWPRLPGRLTALGETWRGARVEARCNRSACVDPETRGGGPENHERPCATMSWRERLDALYRQGGAMVAEISSFWSDGHPLGDGIWSERSAVISVDHGRLLHSRTTIHHGYTGIEREVRLDAVDACAGGLVAAGWADSAAIGPRDQLLTELAARPGTRTENLRAAERR